MAPAEIASTYDVELERISRFEAPIIAERNFVINRALTSAVGTEPDSPQLGELVIDRLATRGVEAQSLSWSALREDENPWELHLTFIQAAKEHHASWQVSNRGTLIKALDDEGRWLTETTAPAPANVTQFPEREDHSPNIPGEPASGEDIDKLLDGLAAQRGRRVPVDYSDDEEEETKPSLLRIPGVKKSKPAEAEPVEEAPSADTSEEVAEAEEDDSDSTGVLPGFDKVEKSTEEPKKAPRKSKRRSVPSWDEIVFGTRND